MYPPLFVLACHLSFRTNRYLDETLKVLTSSKRSSFASEDMKNDTIIDLPYQRVKELTEAFEEELSDQLTKENETMFCAASSAVHAQALLRESNEGIENLVAQLDVLDVSTSDLLKYEPQTRDGNIFSASHCLESTD